MFGHQLKLLTAALSLGASSVCSHISLADVGNVLQAFGAAVLAFAAIRSQFARGRTESGFQRPGGANFKGSNRERKGVK